VFIMTLFREHGADPAVHENYTGLKPPNNAGSR